MGIPPQDLQCEAPRKLGEAYTSKEKLAKEGRRGLLEARKGRSNRRKWVKSGESVVFIEKGKTDSARAMPFAKLEHGSMGW